MFRGPAIDDLTILDALPRPYARLLRDLNGYIAYHGGLHVRGACLAPAWHSLRHNWLGDAAIHRLYPDSLTADDIPFAQDALGDQYIIRDGIVHRLSAETGELQSLQLDLVDFDAKVQVDPVEFLSLQPLWRWRSEGNELQPGQLLSVVPPFVIDCAIEDRSFKAVDALPHLQWLADLARQIKNVPDGAPIKFDFTD